MSVAQGKHSYYVNLRDHKLIALTLSVHQDLSLLRSLIVEPLLSAQPKATCSRAQIPCCPKN